MSARATAWAWTQIEQGSLTPATALVLLKLADRADPRSGACWPSAETTALDTGLGQRTVERSLKELRQLDLITIQPRVDARGFRLTSVFQLNLGGRLDEGQQPPGEAATTRALTSPGHVTASREHLRLLRDEIAIRR